MELPARLRPRIQTSGANINFISRFADYLNGGNGNKKGNGKMLCCSLTVMLNKCAGEERCCFVSQMYVINQAISMFPLILNYVKGL